MLGRLLNPRSYSEMPNLSLFEVAQIMQIPGFFKCDLNLSHSFRHVFFKLARAYRNWAATQDRKVNLALARHRKKYRVHIFLLGSLHFKQTQVNTFSTSVLMHLVIGTCSKHLSYPMVKLWKSPTIDITSLLSCRSSHPILPTKQHLSWSFKLEKHQDNICIYIYTYI